MLELAAEASPKARFDGLRVAIVRDPAQKREAFRLRHDAYVAEGALRPRDPAIFTDAYDLAMTSLIFGVRDEAERLVGSIRFAVQPPKAAGVMDFYCGSEFGVFKEEIAALVDDDGLIMSGARFAVAPRHPRRMEIALLLIFSLAASASAVGARWGVAAARGSHMNFYRRIFRMRQIGPERNLPGLEYPYALLGVDVRREFREIRDGFPATCRDYFEARNPDWAAEVRTGLSNVFDEETWS